MPSNSSAAPPTREDPPAAPRPDGTVSDATVIEPTLPAVRGHVHQTPMWKNRIYSGGHDDADRSIGHVDIGTFE
jgi:hypothetical protein